MAYYLVNRLDTPDLLPDKYIHTFLIRDPKKSVYSLYKMSMNKELTGRCQEISVCIQKSVYPHYKMSKRRGSQVCTHKSVYSLYKMSMNKELTSGYPEICLLPVQISMNKELTGGYPEISVLHLHDVYEHGVNKWAFRNQNNPVRSCMSFCRGLCIY